METQAEAIFHNWFKFSNLDLLLCSLQTALEIEHDPYGVTQRND